MCFDQKKLSSSTTKPFLPNSASLVGRTSILGTLPHIRAAEVGKDAVVIAVDNTLVGAITRSVRGTIDSFLGPMRAILTDLGLYGVPQ